MVLLEPARPAGAGHYVLVQIVMLPDGRTGVALLLFRRTFDGL